MDREYLKGVYLDAETARRIERGRTRLHAHYIIIEPAQPQKELRRPQKGGVDEWRILISRGKSGKWS